MADVIVTANQTLFGEEAQNVFCFGNLVDNAVDLQTFADNFRTSWEVNLATFQVNDWALRSLTFSFIDATQVLYSVEYNFTAGQLVGDNNADNLIAQSCLLVSLQRQNVRPNRGRIYFAGLSDAELVGGLWNQLVIDNADLMVSGWVAGIDYGASVANLRILRRPSAKFPSFVSNSIDSVIPRFSPAVQRSRRRSAA